MCLQMLHYLSLFHFSSDSTCILSTHVPLPQSVSPSSPEPIPDVPASMPQSTCTEQPAPKPHQVFTRQQKVPVAPSALDDSSSRVVDPPPQQSSTPSALI